MLMAVGSSEQIWALVVMVICAGWIIPATIGTIAKHWRRARESEHLEILKQSMIERGMSADEIERVLRAGTAVEVEKES